MKAGSVRTPVTAAGVLSPGPEENAPPPLPSPLPTPSLSTSWLVKSTSAGGREHVCWGSEGACELRPKGKSRPHRSDPAAVPHGVHCTRSGRRGGPACSPPPNNHDLKRITARTGQLDSLSGEDFRPRDWEGFCCPEGEGSGRKVTSEVK